MKTRRSGILLHISSLPSPCGIGDLGPSARRFVDLLAETEQTYWQILPLNPTRESSGNSPYDSPSAFANNTLFISPERMAEEGLLDRNSLDLLPDYPEKQVDFGAVCAFKKHLYHTAYEDFKKSGFSCGFTTFCEQNARWLDNYALFAALLEHFHERPWSEWPPDLRDRRPEAIESMKKELYDRIEREKFLQYVFHRQWQDLKGYCHQKGIDIVGDIPIYVSYNSVDVWAHPDMFKLDEEKQMTCVAGTPPDIFSDTGQLWGSPIYRWDIMGERGYPWWTERIQRTLELYDYVRVDHFRGFFQYWEVPAGEPTAENGKWMPGPGEKFFMQLDRKIPRLPLVV
ncbi:MAG TPA: 4-alpha-glucanotransferase, partial [Methanomicrobiales archaeon]|nr:4-alpha-glucanotransferase [Methanomicrobiales archaeon]